MKHNDPDVKALLTALSNSAIVSETDAIGNITYVNDKFVEISQYSREELIGQNHRILKSGEHTRSFYANMWSTIMRGRVWRGVIKNRAKDGSIYYVDSSIAPITDKTGKPIKYISVRFLVTEQQQAEEALRETIKQQNTLTVIGQEALSNTDLQMLFKTTVRLIRGTIKVENIAILKLLPGGKELLFEAGVGFKNAKPGQTTVSAKRFSNLAGFALYSNQPVYVKDLTNESRFTGCELLHNDNCRSGIAVCIQGAEMPFGLLYVFSEDKRDFQAIDIGFLQSIATLLANAIRNHLDKRKDEFLGIASHEIKTPLTSIKTYTQILYKQALAEGNQQSITFLEKIDQQINKMTNMIADLLDISKINAGKINYNDEKFQLSELIGEIVGDMQLITSKHKILFIKTQDAEVYGDRDRIGQVLTNLILNAIKFSPNTKEIVVHQELRDGQVVISVKDHGIGIPKKDQDLVFSRFYKGETTLKNRAPGGLGLGLYISSQIVRRHEGKIWLDSQENKGSTFYFSLPIKENKYD